MPVRVGWHTTPRRTALPRNTVGCVLEDSAGGLWLGTSAGLAHFDPRHRAFTNYTQADGLPGLDFTGWRACFRADNGEIFLGGFSGAVAFRLKSSPQRPRMRPRSLSRRSNSLENLYRSGPGHS